MSDDDLGPRHSPFVRVVAIVVVIGLVILIADLFFAVVLPLLMGR